MATNLTNQLYYNGEVCGYYTMYFSNYKQYPSSMKTDVRISFKCEIYTGNNSPFIAGQQYHIEVNYVIDGEPDSYMLYVTPEKPVTPVDKTPTYYHCIDGTLNLEVTMWNATGVRASAYPSRDVELDTSVITTEIIEVASYPSAAYTLLSAPNFTDLDKEIIITYTDANNRNFSPGRYLQPTISFGDNEEIAGALYHHSLYSTSYTFELTDEDIERLIQAVTDGASMPVTFKLMTTALNDNEPAYSEITKTFTITGADPILSPTVKDIKEETIALTGDENTFIRYESMAEFAFNAIASKGATIVSHSVTCGSKTIEDLPYGVIDDVESGTFNFYVTDSRNMGAASAVFKNLIEYVKPTCHQSAEIEITGETGATIKLKVSGNYFNGSFGAVDNSLTLEVRRTNDDGEMGEWTAFEATPRFSGTTYSLEVTFGDLDYGKNYIFQSRIIDKLNYVESAQYTITMKPVFDWSKADFNFNVPINIDADNLGMHGETILRHNDAANNTVLSATGGHIYVRPRGTDNTTGETIFYPNGDVKFGGEITLANGTVVGDPTEAFADYVIETGLASMGTNGTWHWAKWASGKAECWGCRNFGNMAVTTSWGNLYRSAFLTQSLPEGLFARTPDSININIVHGGYGGWICKHENAAPSAITTGSFIYVRPASATATPTNIGFYIIGEWK